MLIKRVCISCGASFEGGPRAWYCLNCRKEREKEAKAKYKERKKAGKARELGSEDLCEICGKPYTVESGQQRYCKDCAPEQYKIIDSKQSLELYQKKKDTINPIRNQKRRIAPKTCLICGKNFETHTRAACCSPLFSK